MQAFVPAASLLCASEGGSETFIDDRHRSLNPAQITAIVGTVEAFNRDAPVPRHFVTGHSA